MLHIDQVADHLMGQAMKDVIRTFALVILAAMGLGNGARAADVVFASVPFGFQATGSFLPPGEYKFSIDSNTRLLTISGRNLSASVLLSAGQPLDQSPRTILRFQCSGNQWLHSAVSSGGVAQPVTSDATFKKLPIPQECAGGSALRGSARSFDTPVPLQPKEN